MTRPTYYDILGVGRTASQAEISRVYKRAINRFEAGCPQSTASTFAAIVHQAYQVLDDPERRRLYDAELLSPDRAPTTGLTSPSVATASGTTTASFPAPSVPSVTTPSARSVATPNVTPAAVPLSTDVAPAPASAAVPAAASLAPSTHSTAPGTGMIPDRWAFLGWWAFSAALLLLTAAVVMAASDDPLMADVNAAAVLGGGGAVAAFAVAGALRKTGSLRVQRVVVLGCALLLSVLLVVFALATDDGLYLWPAVYLWLLAGGTLLVAWRRALNRTGSANSAINSAA